MNAHRRIAVAATVVGAAPLLAAALAAQPAAAHGAPTDPVSRAVLCSPETRQDRPTDACDAAIEANDGTAIRFDNLRVPGVAGRDREVIPDGKLCSAGLNAYKGLDVARGDWPATELEPGSDLTMEYRSTIPHKGTFSVYVTRDGYDPGKPLNWDDLEPEPFMTVTDPVLRNDAYRLRGTLPSDKSGRHMLYTIWRNTDTPDTYYSCSDVAFPGGNGTGGGQQERAGQADGAAQPGEDDSGAAPGGGADAGAAPQGAAPSAPGAPEKQTASGNGTAPQQNTDSVSVSNASRIDSLPLLVGGAAAFLGVAAAITAAAVRRR